MIKKSDRGETTKTIYVIKRLCESTTANSGKVTKTKNYKNSVATKLATSDPTKLIKALIK